MEKKIKLQNTVLSFLGIQVWLQIVCPLYLCVSYRVNQPCAGLKETVPHGLMYVNTWSPIWWHCLDQEVWLCGRTCVRGGWLSEFKDPCHFQFALSASCLGSRCELSASPPRNCSPAMVLPDSYLPGTMSLKEPIYMLPWSRSFISTTEK